jgi:hypothetical protein
MYVHMYVCIWVDRAEDVDMSCVELDERDSTCACIRITYIKTREEGRDGGWRQKKCWWSAAVVEDITIYILPQHIYIYIPRRRRRAGAGRGLRCCGRRGPPRATPTAAATINIIFDII